MISKFAADLENWWAILSWVDVFWISFGFMAQAMFAMRFIIQLIASEKVKRSVVPETFWYFSLAGGLGLFLYAIHKVDPVFMLGQGLGLVIYARNIYFISLSKRDARERGLTTAD